MIFMAYKKKFGAYKCTKNRNEWSNSVEHIEENTWMEYLKSV